LRLRLLGGQADTVVVTNPESRRQQLEQDYRQYGQRREAANRAVVVAYHLLTSEVANLTDEQRARAGTRYTQELQNKLDAALLELDCLKDLQALKHRPGYERELSTALEGINPQPSATVGAGPRNDHRHQYPVGSGAGPGAVAE